MKIILFIEDEQLVKRILKLLDVWDVKRKPHPCANGPPTETFIIYDESSSPSADNPLSLLLLRRDMSAFSPIVSARQVNLVDADRSTLSFDPEALDGRLSTGYPIDLSRRSSKNEDGNQPLKRSSRGQTGELCPNLPKCPIPRQKNNVDNKTRFSYQEGYCLC